jgi:acylphosphatase
VRVEKFLLDAFRKFYILLIVYYFMKRLTATVYGLVQGVFFRRNTKDYALNLGLTGYAENLKDRSVKVVAEGDESKLKELLAWLHKGPKSAKVERVKHDYSEATGEFKTFETVWSDEAFWEKK